MTLTAPVAPERVRAPWPPVAVALRAGLVLGWVVVGVLLVALGSREGSYDDLRAAVRDGSVDRVEVAGGWADRSGWGQATATVTWRDGLVRRSAEVVEPSPGGRATDARRGTPVVAGGVAADLRSLDPDLQVDRADERLPRTTVGQWRFADSSGALLVGWIVLTAVFVLASPAPWRMTRWASIWAVALGGPVGLASYLLLAGPVPGLPVPRTTRPLLSGGWAFVLAWVVGRLLPW